MTGFFKKDDKTLCTALTGCSDVIYKTTLQCTQCSTSTNYYATDVKGTAVIADSGDKWEQVCTKAAKIIATTIVALTMIANF